MTMRRLSLGLALLLTLAFSATALASDVPARQAEMRDAIRSLDLDLTGERVAIAKRGRRDLVVHARDRAGDVVTAMQQAYRTRKALPNGYKVKGWAHIAATDTYTFTLERDHSEHFVAEVARVADGSEIRFWGTAYKRAPTRKPLSEIPRRYVRPAGHTVTR